MLTEIYHVIDKPDDRSEILKTASFTYNGDKKLIAYEKPSIDEKDVLQLELKNFVLSLTGKETPIVDGIAGRTALAIAIKIHDMIIQDIH